jgi:NADPH:quinone reductase-like Zn-dependent oxidoreductase
LAEGEEPTLQAMVYRRYGSPDVLVLDEIDEPAPADDEILVKVRAASVNRADWHLLTGKPFLVRLVAGLLKPKFEVLGLDMAGQVERVGKNVRRFRPGDEVFGSARGAFAEYLCARESELAPKPSNLSFEEAASVPTAGVTALQGLRDGGRIRAGQKVLINGASGGVGTFAVQLAKAFDAKVTAVCSGAHLDLVRSIGADRLIDYTEEDFTQTGQRYDLIFDTVAKRSFGVCRPALGSRGTYVTTDASPSRQLQARRAAMLGNQRMVALFATVNRKDLVLLRHWLDAGQIKPVIDRSYRLADVPEALRYIARGHAAGKIVVTM